MKKLIVMDLEQICGSDLVSGISDEKHKCMGYDSRANVYPRQRDGPRVYNIGSGIGMY